MAIDDRTAQALRALPSVDALLQSEVGRGSLGSLPRELAVDALRTALAEARVAIQAGREGASPDELVDQARAHLDRILAPSLRPVVNATGVVIHTNLGRAPLSPAAIAAMEAVSRGYSTLEFDLAEGQRGSRHEHVTSLLQRLTGAEAALVVNNNASAVLLALAALASGREVLISRGELVEIGGGFRIPDVLRQSGARLLEVGTTNRTYVEDYASAVTPETAALLRVHASNFRVVGFVHSATLGELVALAHSRGLLVVDDLGSGSLIPTERYGLLHEPTIQESVSAGADVTCFSGDKLLGGPQAGILVGTAATIGRLRRHPLTRAVRPDKATIAGLAATLTHYLHGAAEREIPVWRMISAPLAELEERGQRMIRDLPAGTASIRSSESAVGGGAVPGDTLPSRAIALRFAGTSPQALAARLRAGDPPIVGHIQDDILLLDLRTILPHEDEAVAKAVSAALSA